MKNLKWVCAILFLLFISPGSWAQRAATQEKALVGVDLGFSSGSYNGRSYTELNLGVNLNFTDWFTWRNAGFKRYATAPEKDILGLDSTLRLISTVPFSSGAFHAFVGGGYRIADPAEKNALVAEGGLGLSIGKVGLGVGAKYLKYNKTQLDSSGFETKNDDISYFITLSGGSSFIF